MVTENKDLGSRSIFYFNVSVVEFFFSIKKDIKLLIIGPREDRVPHTGVSGRLKWPLLAVFFLFSPLVTLLP